MNYDELRTKIINNAICRLCLSEKCEELRGIDDESSESQQKPRALIEKFNLAELSKEIELSVICQPCIFTLDSFYKFHSIITASEIEICKALKASKAENENNDDEVEFMGVDDCEDDNCTYLNEDSEFQESPIACSARNERLPILECDFCLKSYKRKSHLRRHIEKQHKDGRVKSKRKFPSNSKSMPREHSCPVCFKIFPTVSNRNSHLQSHNAEDSVICSICQQGFKSVLYLRKHHRAIHMKVENVCHICNRKFDTQQKFDYHLRTHDTVKRYQCTHDGCNKSFMQHHHLENHKTTHTGISKFLCFKCGKKFRQECNLKAHLRIHEGNHLDSRTCQVANCGKSFKTSSSLRTHQKSHENISHHQCPECNKNFSNRRVLRIHFQTHFQSPSNRIFKCSQPDCNRSFCQGRSLKYHESSAHGIGEPIVRKSVTSIFGCDFSQKTFTLRSLLKRHVLTHLEEEQTNRKHKCNRCDESFKRPEHLKFHINSVHLKFKPYKCEHQGCEKSFAQIGDRNVHMKVHSDEKLHICLICQKAFRLAKGLRAHEKTHVAKKKIESLRDNLPSHEQVSLFLHPEPQESQVDFPSASLPR